MRDRRAQYCAGAAGLKLEQILEKLGGRTRARTWDPMIKSHLLYQLSYAPGANRPGKAFVKSRSFSKATPRCPARTGDFSPFKPKPAARPRRRISATFPGLTGRPQSRSGPPLPPL